MYLLRNGQIGCSELCSGVRIKAEWTGVGIVDKTTSVNEIMRGTEISNGICEIH